jgi:hypothetical protein
MTTKLTLTLDDKVIKGAKKYAKANGRSVSELVESYFKSLTALNNDQADGSFKAPADFDYKKVLGDAKRRKFE